MKLALADGYTNITELSTQIESRQNSIFKLRIPLDMDHIFFAKLHGLHSDSDNNDEQNRHCCHSMGISQ